MLDRTAVILEIFHRHARSRAAKAQVEIVRLAYLAPRLREQGKGADRQRGGIGGKGAGESSLELDRRKIRDRIAELTRELDGLAEEQRTQRARRSEMNRVALVGYTNAGKSTLMRALTGSEVYVADKLFATLDTTVRPLVPATKPRVLVSDTVGFIEKLPHDLVASFKSTLDEALEAGLLAQVVDASDPNWERQLEVTTEVLAEIGAGDVPRLSSSTRSIAWATSRPRRARRRRCSRAGPTPSSCRRAAPRTSLTSARAWSPSSRATWSRTTCTSPTSASSCAARSSPPARSSASATPTTASSSACARPRRCWRSSAPPEPEAQKSSASVTPSTAPVRGARARGRRRPRAAAWPSRPRSAARLAERALLEHAHERFPKHLGARAVLRDGEARARGGDALGVVRLVGEHRDDDQRHARRDRAEDGARAAVTQDRLRVRQHLVLRHEALDVHVGGDLTEALERELLADCEQRAQRQAHERRQHGAIHVAHGLHAARDHSERDVDERIGLPARPPAGQRRRLGARRAKAQKLRVTELRRAERLGEQRERGLVRDRGAGRIGRRSELLAVLLEVRQHPGQQLRVPVGRGDRDAHVRDPLLVPDDDGRVLLGFAHDDVRPKALDRLEEASQRRARGGSREDLADDDTAALLLGDRAEARPEGAQPGVARMTEREEGRARARHVLGEIGGSGHGDLVAATLARLQERNERQKVARDPHRREENAHQRMLRARAWRCQFGSRPRFGVYLMSDFAYAP